MRIGLLFILFSFNLFAAEESVIKNYSDEEQIRYESIWKGMADAEMVTPLSELEAKYLEIDSMTKQYDLLLKVIKDKNFWLLN